MYNLNVGFMWVDSRIVIIRVWLSIEDRIEIVCIEV